ncbi:MAG: saccharopine dehydrogenase family protein [Gammaproteobacteria bacterium]
MRNILIVGAGGVGAALAKKCAQHNDVFGDIVVVARRPQNAKEAADAARPYMRDGARRLVSESLDAKDADAVAGILRRYNLRAVLNAASPHVNLSAMDGALAAGAQYLDSAVYEKEGAATVAEPPWYAAGEWKKRAAFAAAGCTGVLSVGFDPGAVNVFCAHARDNLFDEIDAMDIMDVNDGAHGKFFATNFDAETNLREIREEVIFWENGFRRAAPHTRALSFDFPGIGARRVFLTGHEELHSLPFFIDAPRVRFWMGFSDRYLRVFGVLNKLGLLSPAPVRVENESVAPIKMIKALLPPPQSLAASYRGEICIGVLVRGVKDGKRRAVFVYSTLSHERAFADIGAQAISYSTAVPLAVAARLVLTGEWRANALVHAEELDPAPFLKLMPQMGIGWATREEAPDIDPQITVYDEHNPPVEL